MKKTILFMLATFAGLLPASVQVSAQQTAHNIILHQMNYLMYLPDGYENDTVKKWPMMVFLHGVGECGMDVEKVKWLGPPRKIADGYKYPFIVVSPQSPERGWKPDFIQKLVVDLQTKYRIDEDRIYLTGLSMGGFGTWRTAQACPELFAAIIPVCGGGNDYNVWTLENMPVWCFHGAKDDSVPIAYSQTMIDSLKCYDNPNVKFTIYPEAGHDSWTETYNNEEVYRWMLSHKRFRYEEKPVTPEALNEYAGTYFSEEWNRHDTLQIAVQENTLVMNAVTTNSIQSFKFAGNDKFFTLPDKFMNFKFVRDEKKKIIGVTFYDIHYKHAWTKE